MDDLDEFDPEIHETDTLSRAGRQLFDSLYDALDPYSLTVLILEASRIKDRLDLLHRLNSGDEDLWFHLAPTRGDGDVLEIKIDSGLQEARQLAAVLRQMLVEIGRQKSPKTGADDYDGLADL
jgi:hypothetical protein